MKPRDLENLTKNFKRLTDDELLRKKLGQMELNGQTLTMGANCKRSLFK